MAIVDPLRIVLFCYVTFGWLSVAFGLYREDWKKSALRRL